jgi:hypothetical protein
MVLNGLDYEDYDAIVKSNYRYRKLFNVSLVSLDKICPVRMIAFRLFAFGGALYH